MTSRRARSAETVVRLSGALRRVRSGGTQGTGGGVSGALRAACGVWCA